MKQWKYLSLSAASGFTREGAEPVCVVSTVTSLEDLEGRCVEEQNQTRSRPEPDQKQTRTRADVRLSGQEVGRRRGLLGESISKES